MNTCQPHNPMSWQNELSRATMTWDSMECLSHRSLCARTSRISSTWLSLGYGLFTTSDFMPILPCSHCMIPLLVCTICSPWINMLVICHILAFSICIPIVSYTITILSWWMTCSYAMHQISLRDAYLVLTLTCTYTSWWMMCTFTMHTLSFVCVSFV